MNGFGDMGDYKEELSRRILPATGSKKPFGPDNLPITAPTIPAPVGVDATNDLLTRILAELIRQSTSATPKIRSAAVTNTGATLDWTVLGYADRLMLANLGPDPIWFNFDQSGGAVSTTTGDSSFQLPSGSTANPSLCKFTKVGVRTKAGMTATVCAIAFHNVAGSQQGVIS